MDNVTIIYKYFDSLSHTQQHQFTTLGSCLRSWMRRVNVISKGDTNHLYTRHILHSLGLAKLIAFQEGTHILDVGSGGGLPGIPLAILFPHTTFVLTDAIQKKVHIMRELVQQLQLTNTEIRWGRVEHIIEENYDFVISRAVTSAYTLWAWVGNNINPVSAHTLANGMLYLKGGHLEKEMQELGKPYTIHPIAHYFEESFFATKQIVHVPL